MGTGFRGFRPSIRKILFFKPSQFDHEAISVETPSFKIILLMKCYEFAAESFITSLSILELFHCEYVVRLSTAFFCQDNEYPRVPRH